MHFVEGGAAAVFPRIDVSRLTEEFGVMPEEPKCAVMRVLAELAQSAGGRAAG